ncbi:ribonuclease PH [candidate division WOR-3 bacterium]|nr:ribonuclease PH [candidate division WOR-3 bacterium]
MRADGRKADQLRPLSFELGYLKFARGSCLASAGDTHVLAAASYQPEAPPWLEDTGKGWITAEYSMLPASTPERNPRESRKGRPSARSQEISRLIGRSLRMGFDLDALGENTLIIDTDVLQADGGTRTLSICAGFCAAYDACLKLNIDGLIPSIPFKRFVAAVSVGIVGGKVLADLCYEEDSRAEVDANIVATDNGEVIELQLTAEREPVCEDLLNELLDMGRRKVTEIIGLMRKTLNI